MLVLNRRAPTSWDLEASNSAGPSRGRRSDDIDVHVYALVPGCVLGKQ